MKKQSVIAFLIASVFSIITVPKVRANELQTEQAAPSAQEDDFPRFRIGFEKEAFHLGGYIAHFGSNQNRNYLAGSISILPRGYTLPSLNLGYRLTERVFLGSEIKVDMSGSLAKDVSDHADVPYEYRTETKDFGVMLAPHVSYWFGEKAVRPFLELEAILRKDFEKRQSGDEIYDSHWKSSQWGVGGGLGGGVHIFVGKHISLDVSLLGNYEFQKYHSRWVDKFADEDGNIEGQPDSSRTISHSFALSGNLGISGWI